MMPIMMTTEAFLELFEKELNNFLNTALLDAPNALKKAAMYACFSGGKRIRPTLCFLSSVFCGISPQFAIDFAIPIELIHTYSLIHDDLPSMDNDDFRRGRPTVHKQFGEAIALLCGDALLNLSYERLLKLTIDQPSMASGAYYIARNAGISGMVGGQTEEFSLEKDPDLDDYVKICKGKTGALITASLIAPATLSFNANKLSAITSYGNYLGLCFQITDDLLDKNTGEKMSFVSIVGEDQTTMYLDKCKREAIHSIQKFGQESLPLIDFCEKICLRTH